MKININNYESYFLLYIDNELSISDRRLVEDFVSRNPALKEELELLQDTVLPMNEEIKFNRETLYKSEVVPDKLQENMLLHLDNELEPAAAEELLKTIARDTSLETDWNILQKTRLDAALVIPFPGKNILYKKERARIVSIAYVKWAVAAAVIAGGIFWGIRFNMQPPAGSNEIASTKTGKVASPGTENNITAKTTTTQTNSNAGTEVVASEINKEKKVEQKNTPVNNLSGNTLAQVNIKQDIKTRESKAEQNQDKAEQILVKVEDRGISNPGIGTLNIKKTSTDKTDLLAAMTAKDKPKSLAENTDLNIIPVSNSYASVASLNETSNDNHIFLMDQDKLEESKAGIFLKKLKRTVTRTTNISPGKTLKIAGFEFAVK